MRRLFATTLGQILAIIASSSAVTFLLFLVLVSTLYPSVPPPPPWPWPAVYRIEGLVYALRAAPENEQGVILAATQRPDMTVMRTEAPAVCASLTNDTRDLQSALTANLNAAAFDVTVRDCGSEISANNIQVIVGWAGRTIEIRTRKVETARFNKLTFPFVGALLFLCVAVAAMSAWAVWRVIRPLRRLSAKADAFGQNMSIAPIDEAGPLEIRNAARAFNLMQERITRSIQDRTRALAAISHDLRTPLTRMRLQLETGTTEIARGKLLKDIGLMQSMLTSALAFLSGNFDEEEKEWLDLGALLSTLCDEYEQGGAAVSYEGPEQIRFFCRPNAITRAVSNLVENGIHFGSSVTINASCQGNRITIDVIDDGPGIPAERLQDVVEPFVRLDASRSSRPGSAGLGLSIVKEIVEAHGGTLELIARQPTGLMARITFRT